MIQMGSRLDVADNSGAKIVECIKVIGGSKKRIATVGEVIVCSVKKAATNSNVKPGTVVKCLIVRTRYPMKRRNGVTVRFDSNAVVLLSAQGEPVGTRVFGAIAREVREANAKEHSKIISLAPEVL